MYWGNWFLFSCCARRSGREGGASIPNPIDKKRLLNINMICSHRGLFSPSKSTFMSLFCSFSRCAPQTTENLIKTDKASQNKNETKLKKKNCVSLFLFCKQISFWLSLSLPLPLPMSMSSSSSSFAYGYTMIVHMTYFSCIKEAANEFQEKKNQ